MIITIVIAVGSALLHWLLQRQAVSRYEKCMREAIEAAKSAKLADESALKTHNLVARHMIELQPALAALPKTRSPRKAKPMQVVLP